MKVKIITSAFEDVFEEKINKFLKEDIKVIDIKYTAYSDGHYKAHCAMIMYDELIRYGATKND